MRSHDIGWARQATLYELGSVPPEVMAHEASFEGHFAAERALRHPTVGNFRALRLLAVIYSQVTLKAKH